MAKNKLKKFDEIKKMPNVLQPDLKDLEKGFKYKGKWREMFFLNSNPIILELGCGKGEYTIGLAKKNTNQNFITKDEANEMIESALRRHNRRSTIISSFLGWILIGGYSFGLFHIVQNV